MTALVWGVALALTVWVYIDAKNLGVSEFSHKGWSYLSPLGWAVLCFAFWIFFLWYFYKRREYKQLRGLPVAGKNSSLVFGGLALIAVVLVALFALSNMKLDTETLSSEVENHIRENLSENKRLSNLEIKSFNLVHKEGNSYEGLLLVNDGDLKDKTIKVKVTYDGERFMWELEDRGYR